MFHATPPRTDGAEASFSPNLSEPRTVAVYHSHGANSHGQYDDEHFSGAQGDKAWSDDNQVPLYLVTPAGVMQRYDPDPNRQLGGSVTQIGGVGP
jgi:hypothetical protein